MRELINKYLNNPGIDKHIWKNIIDRFDYQNQHYVEDFLGLIEELLTTR